MVSWLALLTLVSQPSRDQIRRELNAAFARHQVCRVRVVTDTAGIAPILNYHVEAAVVRSGDRLKTTESTTTYYRDPRRKPEQDDPAEMYADKDRCLILFQSPVRPGIAVGSFATLDGFSPADQGRTWAVIPELAFGNVFAGHSLVQAVDAARTISEFNDNGRSVIRVETEGRWGRIELLLDPKAGYLPVKTVNWKGRNDLTATGKKLSEFDEPVNKKRFKGEVSEFTEVQTALIGGRHVVAGYRRRLVMRYDDGSENVLDERYRLTNWSFPDSIPESEFKFACTIPDGLAVTVTDRPTILHEWRGGEIVKLGPTGTVSQLEKLEGFEIRPGDATVYYASAAVFALALVALVVWRWRMLRSGEF